MTPRTLRIEADGWTHHFGTMKDASLAFGKMLTTHSNVRLVEQLLDGDHTIAHHIETAIAQSYGVAWNDCPVCGKSWCHGHEQDPTAQRILMQHEHQNHTQCHPGSGCKREEGTSAGRE